MGPNSVTVPPLPCWFIPTLPTPRPAFARGLSSDLSLLVASLALISIPADLPPHLGPCLPAPSLPSLCPATHKSPSTISPTIHRRFPFPLPPAGLSPPSTVFIACMTAQVPLPSKAFTARCYSCISIEPIKANLFALISIYFSLVDIRFPFLLRQHDFLFVFLMVYPPLSSSINLVGFPGFKAFLHLPQPLD